MSAARGETSRPTDERADELLPGDSTGDAAAGGRVPEPVAQAAAGAEGDDAGALRDRWLRAEADLQNYRRRAARDREEARRNAEESVMLELIGMIDDLERALAVAREGGAPESWTQGVQLVVQRGLDSLRRAGVTVVDPAGQPFDPAFQEAMLEIDPPAGSAPGVVVEVIQRGYAREGRALRPARVVVARSAAPEADG